jgi:hypothetical protein
MRLALAPSKSDTNRYLLTPQSPLLIMNFPNFPKVPNLASSENNPLSSIQQGLNPQAGTPFIPQVSNVGSLSGTPVQQLAGATSPLVAAQAAAQQAQSKLPASSAGLPSGADLSSITSKISGSPASSGVAAASQVSALPTNVQAQLTQLPGFAKLIPAGTSFQNANAGNIVTQLQALAQKPQGADQTVQEQAQAVLAVLQANSFGAPTQGGSGPISQLPLNQIEGLATETENFAVNQVGENVNQTVNQVNGDLTELGIPAQANLPLNSQLGGQVLQVVSQLASSVQQIQNYLSEESSKVPTGNLPS